MQLIELLQKKKNIFIPLVLFVVFYFIFFHNIGTYPLMDIDETRYVLMSKDMLKSHDFMTLYLNGEYFFEKPPLYFWIECIFFKLFGFVNEFSARFPAALSGMLLCYAVYFSGKKFISNFYGVVSSLVLATCLEFTILSKYAILDIYLCLFCALSVFSYFGTHVAAEKNKKYFWWLFYLFCALAVMAKGIPGLVIPAGTVFFSSLYTKTFKEIFKPLYIIPGIVLFLAITLPWHIIMIKTHTADPSFFHEYVIKHHLQRFVNSKELGRKQPWFYFLVTLCWGLVPWVASLIAVFVAKIKNFSLKTWGCDYHNKPKLFFALNVITALFVILFFSSSSTKLVTYILPVYPFAACIIGYIWTKYMQEGENKKAINVSVFVFSGICILCAVAAIFMKYFLPSAIYEDIKSIQWFSIAAILFTQVPAVLFLIKQNLRAVFGCYVAFIMLLSAFGTPLFYKLDYKFGQNDLMNFIRYAKENSLKLYALNTGRRFSLNYYGDSKNVFYIKDETYKNIPEIDTESVVVIRIKDYKKHAETLKNYTPIKTGRKYLLLKPLSENKK